MNFLLFQEQRKKLRVLLNQVIADDLVDQKAVEGVDADALLGLERFPKC